MDSLQVGGRHGSHGLRPGDWKRRERWNEPTCVCAHGASEIRSFLGFPCPTSFSALMAEASDWCCAPAASFRQGLAKTKVQELLEKKL